MNFSFSRQISSMISVSARISWWSVTVHGCVYAFRSSTVTSTFRWPKSGLVIRSRTLPAFVNGHDGMLLEAAAGLLDDATPDARIRAEAEEETGYRVRGVRKVFEAFMSPGLVTEKLHFFVGEYDASLRTGDGGGIAEEGEDLEVVEMPLQAALDAVERGEIVDAKTIMLLQYVALRESAGGRAATA